MEFETTLTHTHTQLPRVKQQKVYNISNIKDSLGVKTDKIDTLGKKEREERPPYKPIQNLKNILQTNTSQFKSHWVPH